MKVLNSQTKHCKICFKQINSNSLNNLFDKNSCLCEDCFSNFKPKFISFKHGSIQCLSIYEYDQNIKDLLYKYKGCYDYELKDVFLNRYLWFLKFKYLGFYLICVPSYFVDDEKRGFNHVNEIAKTLKKPILNCLVKTDRHKQASSTAKERKDISKIFKINNGQLITKKKILLLDDVYTTGSSIDASISLIKQFNPKKIEVLVVSKNVLKQSNR